MRKMWPYFLWNSACSGPGTAPGRHASLTFPSALLPAPARFLPGKPRHPSARCAATARLGEGLERGPGKGQGIGAREGIYQSVVLFLEPSFPEDLQEAAQQRPVGGARKGGRVLRLATFQQRAEGHLPRPRGRARRGCHGPGWLTEAAQLLQEGNQGATLADGAAHGRRETGRGGPRGDRGGRGW